MTSVVPESWDRVYIFPAYGWPDYVNKQLGFHWPGGTKSKTNVQDRYQLVVFVYQARVVAWADFDTVDGRFDVTGDFLSRSDATFRIAHADGETRIVRKGTLPSIQRFSGPLQIP